MAALEEEHEGQALAGTKALPVNGERLHRDDPNGRRVRTGGRERWGDCKDRSHDADEAQRP